MPRCRVRVSEFHALSGAKRLKPFDCRRRRLASWREHDYIRKAGLPGASGAIIPGALSILTGAVPGRARGLGHMAPTYLRREPGIERSDGQCGSALSPLPRYGVRPGMLDSVVQSAKS